MERIDQTEKKKLLRKEHMESLTRNTLCVLNADLQFFLNYEDSNSWVVFFEVLRTTCGKDGPTLSLFFAEFFGAEPLKSVN